MAGLGGFLPGCFRTLQGLNRTFGLWREVAERRMTGQEHVTHEPVVGRQRSGMTEGPA